MDFIIKRIMKNIKINVGELSKFVEYKFEFMLYEKG